MFTYEDIGMGYMDCSIDTRMRVGRLGMTYLSEPWRPLFESLFLGVPAPLQDNFRKCICDE